MIFRDEERSKPQRKVRKEHSLSLLEKSRGEIRQEPERLGGKKKDRSMKIQKEISGTRTPSLSKTSDVRDRGRASKGKIRGMRAETSHSR